MKILFLLLLISNICFSQDFYNPGDKAIYTLHQEFEELRNEASNGFSNVNTYINNQLQNYLDLDGNNIIRSNIDFGNYMPVNVNNSFFTKYETIFGISSGRFFEDGSNNNCITYNLIYDSTYKTYVNAVYPQEDNQDFNISYVFSLSQSFKEFDIIDPISFKGKVTNNSGNAKFSVDSIIDSSGNLFDLSSQNIESNSSSMTKLIINNNILNGLSNSNFLSGEKFLLNIKCFGDLGDVIFIDEENTKANVVYE